MPRFTFGISSDSESQVERRMRGTEINVFVGVPGLDLVELDLSQAGFHHQLGLVHLGLVHLGLIPLVLVIRSLSIIWNTG